MKRKTAILLALLMLLGGLFSTVEAEKKSKTPPYLVLEQGQMLFSGKVPLSIGHTSSPEVVDWNNDKKPDLLVGTFSQGKTMIFINKGSKKKPKLDSGSVIMVGGSPLTVGCG